MSDAHIVRSYDEDLKTLETYIAEMGGLAENQLGRAIKALASHDTELAAEVVADDQKIDDLEATLDTFALELIARRQPMADDLRFVMAGIKTASNIERIGDYAKNIAKRCPVIVEFGGLRGAIKSVSRMGDITRVMIENVLDAYINRDADIAQDVRLQDEEVDSLYNSLFRELLTFMMEDPRNITVCTHLLFIAKNIERIGDHTTNIAEYIHFMVHGTVPDADRPKGDDTAKAKVS